MELWISIKSYRIQRFWEADVEIDIGYMVCKWERPILNWELPVIEEITLKNWMRIAVSYKVGKSKTIYLFVSHPYLKSIKPMNWVRFEYSFRNVDDIYWALITLFKLK